MYNGYSRKKRTLQTELKSWTRLFAFHITPNTFGEGITNYSPSNYG